MKISGFRIMYTEVIRHTQESSFALFKWIFNVFIRNHCININHHYTKKKKFKCICIKKIELIRYQLIRPCMCIFETIFTTYK